MVFKRPRAQRGAVVVSVVALMLTVSSCGDDSSTPKGSGGASEDTSVKFSGDPITVMTISPYDNAIIDYPEPLDVAKGAAIAINNDGGINGHELKVITCNEGGDPNKAADCAREAVSKKVAAMVGGFGTNGDQVLPILEKANIPWVGPALVSQAEFTSKLSFPITAGILTLVGLGQKAVQDGCKKVASLNYDLPASEATNQLLGAGVTAAGGNFAKQIAVPPTTSDFSGIAKDVSDYDCVIVGLPPQPFVGIVAAGASLGSKTKFYITGGGLTTGLTDQIGDQITGAVSATSFPVGTDPIWDDAKKLAGDFADSKNGGWSGPFVQNTWVAYMTLANLMKDSDDLSSQSIIDTFNQATDVDTGGFTPAFGFTTEFPVPGLNRVFNRQVLFEHVEGKKIVQDGDEYTDLSTSLGTPG